MSLYHVLIVSLKKYVHSANMRDKFQKKTHIFHVLRELKFSYTGSLIQEQLCEHLPQRVWPKSLSKSPWPNLDFSLGLCSCALTSSTQHRLGPFANVRNLAFCVVCCCFYTQGNGCGILGNIAASMESIWLIHFLHDFRKKSAYPTLNNLLSLRAKSFLCVFFQARNGHK